MPLSINHDEKVLDFHYKKHSDGYKFYIGEIFIGVVSSWEPNNWTAINWYKDPETIEGFNSVEGFGSRGKASDYLLRLNEIGGYGIQAQERRDSIARLKAKIEEVR